MPVLPLATQRYLHYLYAPLIGLALALGVAGLLLVGYVVRSEALIRRRCEDVLPLAGAAIPSDPLVRKAELIRRVTARVARAVPEPHARVVFVTPVVDSSSGYYNPLIPAVFDGGRGLRALLPSIDSVAFVERWTCSYHGFDLLAGGEDGLVVAFGRGRQGQLAFARALAANGYAREAREQLEAIGACDSAGRPAAGEAARAGDTARAVSH